MSPDAGAKFLYQRISVSGLRPLYWRNFRTNCGFLLLSNLQAVTPIDLCFLWDDVLGLDGSKGRPSGIHKFEKAAHRIALRVCSGPVLPYDTYQFHLRTLSIEKEDDTMPVICNNCGHKLPDDSVFCPKCGTKVTVIRCTGCGAVLSADAKFCSNCGTPVRNALIPAESETTAEQVVRTAEVREISAEPKIDLGEAAQPSPDRTTFTDVRSQAPRRFEWQYWSVSILRGYGTTKNAVEVTDENVVINSKLNKRAIYDATTVSLKDIASVEVWEKVSVISSLMVAILVGAFIGLVVLIPFGATAIDIGTTEGIVSMLGIAILVAIVIYAGFFRTHHWRITIKTPKEPQYRIYELSAKPKDHEILFQLQKAILDQAGIQGDPVRKKSNKLLPTFVVSIILVLAIIAAMLLSRPGIFEAKKADDTVGKDPVQTVEDGPTSEPKAEPTSEQADKAAINPPQYGDWVYDPAGLISVETADWLRAQNAMWSIDYQSVTAVAAITDALEYEDVDAYAYALADEWGLSENDMMFLIYHDGDFWEWYPNQTLYDYYEDGFGLQSLLYSFQAGYEDGGIDNALRVFFDQLDSHYAMAYTVPADDEVDFDGIWEDIGGRSCELWINAERIEDYYTISITWWVGTQYNVEWSYAGKYDAALGGIDCYQGTRTNYYSGISSEKIYSGTGTAWLRLTSDGRLSWENLTDDLSEEFPDMTFVFQRVNT